MSLAVALFGCAKSGGPGAGFQMPPMPVEVSEVRPRVAKDQFRALGTLEAQEILTVVAEVSAKVEKILFAEGRAVAEGDVLVQMDSREMGAEAVRAQAQREQAKLNFERSEKLHEQNVVSEQELDNARTALKVAEANETFADARLDKTRIRAPWSGLIGRRRISPGAWLSPGDPIAELARVDRMKVAFAAPERYAGQLKPGIPITVWTPAYPGETFDGQVTVVDPIIDPQSRTVQMVGQLLNPGRRLRPGMSANVIVTFSERPMALVVPDEAVFAEGTQNFVYQVNPDSSVARTPVSLGARDSAFVEVVGGLEPGAVVVKAGHQKLFPGARVLPVSSEALAGGGGAPGRKPPGGGAPPPSKKTPGAAMADTATH
jgi:membrane fusion protein, multidrug efflux system